MLLEQHLHTSNLPSKSNARSDGSGSVSTVPQQRPTTANSSHGETISTTSTSRSNNSTSRSKKFLDDSQDDDMV